MKGRVIVYSILIGALALLAYFGLKIGARPLIWLAGVGIVFLIIQLIKGDREEADWVSPHGMQLAFLWYLHKTSIMSATHKEILLKGNAAIDKGNHEGFLSLCTDDTEWVFVGDRTLKGKQAVREYMATAYVVPPVVTVDHLISEGEFLTAIGEITMKDKDGKETHYCYCDVWRFDGELWAELKAFVIEKK